MRPFSSLPRTRSRLTAGFAAALLCACSMQPRGNAIRYLALGDSYTIGESVAESERWPVLLAAKLREQGFAIDRPEIIARTGWTTDELENAIRETSPTPPYDLVSLLIGVNNQYRGHSPAEYREQFARLLEQAIGFAGGDPANVVVLSIPDWGVTPFAEDRDRAKIALDIDLFNSINRDETERRGARYVDITPLSRRPDPDLVAEDGLHPSGSMYRLWVEAALPAAVQAIRGQ